jgi:hypothetical protein
MLTAERLRELLDYNPETGIFRWNVAARAGTVVGCLNRGYRVIRVDRMLYRAHRLAWLHVYGCWPTDEIDHINGIKDDNRLANLREVTCAENQQNRRSARTDNKTGLLGVSSSQGGFQAQIKVNCKLFFLGRFATAELAHAAYLEAKRRLHPAGML